MIAHTYWHDRKLSVYFFQTLFSIDFKYTITVNGCAFAIVWIPMYVKYVDSLMRSSYFWGGVIHSQLKGYQPLMPIIELSGQWPETCLT